MLLTHIDLYNRHFEKIFISRSFYANQCVLLKIYLGKYVVTDPKIVRYRVNSPDLLGYWWKINNSHIIEDMIGKNIVFYEGGIILYKFTNLFYSKEDIKQYKEKLKLL